MRDRVLEILIANARTPTPEIARRLGISESEVEEHIAELEQSKMILGYGAILNMEKLDDEPTVGIIEVNINPERGRGYDAIAEQIYRFPEVRSCYLISGDYDLLVFVEGDSLKTVAGFVSERLATIDNVTRTRSHFILKRYKVFGVAMGGDEKADRLAVS